jgi:hypothetical protein
MHFTRTMLNVVLCTMCLKLHFWPLFTEYSQELSYPGQIRASEESNRSQNQITLVCCVQSYRVLLFQTLLVCNCCILYLLKLLDHEVHAREQVPLLMEMRKADLALDKAIESGDPQLVYRVLDELKHKMYHSQMDRYLQLFHHRPVAAALYKKLCKETDRAQLLSFYRQESESKEAGCLLLSRSFVESDPGESDKCSMAALQEFREGQHTFEVRIAEELLKLRKEQEELESKLKLRVIGLSLFDTVVQCIKNQHLKMAEQLRREYKLSDNQFWWAKLRALCAIGDFEELERFSRQKKSPIGYEPFAEMCIQHGNRKEAAKYIPKCAAEERFPLYLKIEYVFCQCMSSFVIHIINFYTVTL